MEIQIWRHRQSGERYVVALQGERVIDAAGPLHHSEIAAARAGDYNGDAELRDDIDGDQESYAVEPATR